MGQHSEQFNLVNKHGHLPFKMLLMFAWRNLWRHRKRTIITLSSIAIGFGLAVLSIGIGDGSLPNKQNYNKGGTLMKSGGPAKADVVLPK